MREPFRSCRAEIRLASIQSVAEERQRRRLREDAKEKQREWAKKSAKVRRARAVADAMGRGETMLERKRRMHREASRRRYAEVRLLDEGRRA